MPAHTRFPNWNSLPQTTKLNQIISSLIQILFFPLAACKNGLQRATKISQTASNSLKRFLSYLIDPIAEKPMFYFSQICLRLSSSCSWSLTFFSFLHFFALLHSPVKFRINTDTVKMTLAMTLRVKYMNVQEEMWSQLYKGQHQRSQPLFPRFCMLGFALSWSLMVQRITQRLGL